MIVSAGRCCVIYCVCVVQSPASHSTTVLHPPALQLAIRRGDWTEPLLQLGVADVFRPQILDGHGLEAVQEEITVHVEADQVLGAPLRKKKKTHTFSNFSGRNNRRI